jgi:hypothetical protein
LLCWLGVKDLTGGNGEEIKLTQNAESRNRKFKTEDRKQKTEFRRQERKVKGG